MKEPIFKDSALQDQFEKDGFVKLQLFERQTVDKLNALLNEYFPDDTEAFFSSSYLNEYEVKKEMSDRIVATIEEEISAKFTNCRSIGAAFLIKSVGKSGEMPMHQDWTIVDESEYYAVNMWIPLTNTNVENGTIEVMKGSHNWIPALRAPSLPFPFEGHQERIKKSLTIVEANMGEVVILNQAIIHYSKPNMSSERRPAITTGVISEKAPLIFHYWDKDQNQQIEKFEQADDFLLRFEDFHTSIFERPKNAKSIGFVPYQIPQVTDQTLDGFLGKEPSKNQKQGFLSRLFSR